MTTIFCNKRYIIADRRVTLNSQEIDEQFKGCRISRDSQSKIFDLRSYDVFYRDKRVEVMTACGAVGFINQIIYQIKLIFTHNKTISKKRKIDDRVDLELILEFASELHGGAYPDGEIATVYFALEHEEILKVTFRTNGKLEGTDVLTRSFWSHPDCDTQIDAIFGGSGYTYFLDFENFINPDVDEFSKFLFACHLDPNSSCGTFTTYDRRTKKLQDFEISAHSVRAELKKITQGIAKRIVDYKKPETVYSPSGKVHGTLKKNKVIKKVKKNKNKQ